MLYIQHKSIGKDNYDFSGDLPAFKKIERGGVFQ